jgi:ABC-type sugar transport system ATPase subunit
MRCPTVAGGSGVSQELLGVERLSKTFPGLKALDEVSLSVGSGEIVALVGQNGSGKSTLVKVLAGVHHADPGARIRLAGEGERAAGVAEMHFIHQDLGLVEMLSTVENLDLGHRRSWRSLLPTPTREERAHAEELIARFGLSFDVRVPVAELSAAERTIVAIARALDGWTHSRNLLVLDEPTASLHGEEVSKLFEAVRRVAGSGAGVVFISHRLGEVMELADRVVVLRDGRVVADVERGGFDHDELVALITGVEVARTADRAATERAEVVFSARGIQGSTVKGLDLNLHADEIVGVSGVLGSGREQLAGILFGVAEGRVGEIRVGGRSLRGLTPRSAIDLGVAYMPGDRHRLGAVMSLSARENITLPRLGPLRRMLGRLDRSAERADVRRWIDAVGVNPPDPERALELFSGGNQQKVVLAKWLRNEPKALLLDEPTQGVDVGAKVGILELIAAAAAAGAGVLISSSDDKELALVCDRVLVMRDGELAAEVEGAELSEGRLVREGLGPGLNGNHETAASRDEADA